MVNGIYCVMGTEIVYLTRTAPIEGNSILFENVCAITWYSNSNLFLLLLLLFIET